MKIILKTKCIPWNTSDALQAGWAAARGAQTTPGPVGVMQDCTQFVY